MNKFLSFGLFCLLAISCLSQAMETVPCKTPESISVFQKELGCGNMSKREFLDYKDDFHCFLGEQRELIGNLIFTIEKYKALKTSYQLLNISEQEFEQIQRANNIGSNIEIEKRIQISVSLLKHKKFETYTQQPDTGIVLEEFNYLWSIDKLIDKNNTLFECPLTFDFEKYPEIFKYIKYLLRLHKLLDDNETNLLESSLNYNEKIVVDTAKLKNIFEIYKRFPGRSFDFDIRISKKISNLFNECEILLEDYLATEKERNELWTRLDSSHDFMVKELEQDSDLIFQELMNESPSKTKNKTKESQKSAKKNNQYKKKNSTASKAESVAQKEQLASNTQENIQPLVNVQQEKKIIVQEKKKKPSINLNNNNQKSSNKAQEYNAYITLTNDDGIEFVFYKAAQPSNKNYKLMFDQRVTNWFTDPELPLTDYRKEGHTTEKILEKKIAHRAPKLIIPYLGQLGVELPYHNKTNPDEIDTTIYIPGHIQFPTYRLIGFLEITISSKGLCYHWYFNKHVKDKTLRKILAIGYWNWAQAHMQHNHKAKNHKPSLSV